jgi:aminoglycoside phosphotransferase (APT) family kinase protein
MSPDECLPPQLRGSGTTITKIATGLSGAGVYRVEANGEVYALKVASTDVPIAVWRSRVAIQTAAAGAGVAARVIHSDEARRAVVSAFVVDRAFSMLYFNPATRGAALALLGKTIRRVHELPIPEGAEAKEPRAFLGEIWATLAGLELPPFVGNAVARARAEDPPPRERAVVLSHNDVNPSNLVYDGEHLVLLDWDTAGPSDPFQDLAAISVFLRMDEETCLQLLAAYDGVPATTMSPSFAYHRRLVAVLCGCAFLHLARQRGHAGSTADSALELGQFYQQLRAGTVNIAAADGQWAFGLSLVQASLAL